MLWVPAVRVLTVQVACGLLPPPVSAFALHVAIDAFNERQMTPESAPVTQQQKIQPKKEDE
jgi:hypothetical protein